MDNCIVYKSSLWHPGELEEKLLRGLAIRFSLSEWRDLADKLPAGTYSVQLSEGSHPVKVRKTDSFPENKHK